MYVCVFVVLFMPMVTESCDQLLRPCAGTCTLSEAFVDVTKVVLFWTLPSCDGLVGIAQTVCRLFRNFRNNLQAGGGVGRPWWHGGSMFELGHCREGKKEKEKYEGFFIP